MTFIVVAANPIGIFARGGLSLSRLAPLWLPSPDGQITTHLSSPSFKNILVPF
jgi:hypothetical protein